MIDHRNYKEERLQAYIKDIQSRLGHSVPLGDPLQAYEELLNDFAEQIFSSELNDKKRREMEGFYDKDSIPILSQNYETADPNGVYFHETEHYGFAGRITFTEKKHGEYFDIRPLNDDYLAIMMCDTSAKSGLFPLLRKARIAGFFDDLCTEIQDQFNQNPRYKPTVGNWLYHLNDSIVQRTIPINLQIHFINVKTGEDVVSYAGDNWIHFWNSQKGQVENYRLGDVPAIGQIPHTFGQSVYERYAGPYQEIEIQWSPGDILFFLNDGLQQSRRYFMNAEGERIKYGKCPPENIKEDIVRSGIAFPLKASEAESISMIEDTDKYLRGFGREITLSTPADDHKTDIIENADQFADRLINFRLPHPFRLLTGHGLPVPKASDEYAEFGFRRVFEITDKVLKKENYTLEFVGNRPFDSSPVFNFFNGNGTIQEVIRAVFAVERIFRLRPESSATDKDRIRINKTQVAFLQERMSGFEGLFANEGQDMRENLAEYSHLTEDAQENIYSFWCYRQK